MKPAVVSYPIKPGYEKLRCLLVCLLVLSLRQPLVGTTIARAELLDQAWADPQAETQGKRQRHRKSRPRRQQLLSPTTRNYKSIKPKIIVYCFYSQFCVVVFWQGCAPASQGHETLYETGYETYADKNCATDPCANCSVFLCTVVHYCVPCTTVYCSVLPHTTVHYRVIL